MSSRFGRNKRRLMREEMAAIEDARKSAAYTAEQALATLRNSRERFERELSAARRARDTIRISVDALRDDREDGIYLQARFDMARREPIYSAHVLSDRLMDDSQFERSAFIKEAGQLIAEHALEQIVRLWRSR